ncbi:MAG: DUF1549 and DUF1553 domain-containing protein, partial [Pirellulales bacterium]
RGAVDPRDGTPAATVEKTIDVEQGRQYWAFQPLAAAEPPQVGGESWCRTPVDRFVLAKLEEKRLAPAAPADRRRLIRRAYFDLIGLPPEPAEVEAFVNDPNSNAYERLVDTLLASPHYGERWGRHWLDLARFAESHGFEQDYDRPNAYHYRDFVIRALNEDLPYDTFVKWQIAGDEFEPDNPLAMMATGFLAAGVHATQITANQAEKERYDELDDMTRTIGTTMLGLTIGCARCHDHKFDPIPNADYYRLVSTFSTTVRSDLDVNMDPEGYAPAKAEFDTRHAPLAAQLEQFERESLPARFDSWLASGPAASAFPWLLVEPAESKAEGGAEFVRQDDGSLLVKGNNPDHDTYTFVARTLRQGITAIRLETLSDDSLRGGGPGRADSGTFALSGVRVTAAPLVGGPAVEVKLAAARASSEKEGMPASHALDGKNETAWSVDPQPGRDQAIVLETEGEIGFTGGTVLTVALDFKASKQHGIGRPRLAVTSRPRPAALEGVLGPQAVTDALTKLAAESPVELSETERALLMTWYRPLDAEWQRLNEAVVEHARLAPRPKLAKVLVSSEGVPAVRLHTQGADFYDPTYFLRRGDPNQKLDVARQGFLQVLMRSPEGESRWQQPPPEGWRTSYRRRSLANWLTDTEYGAGNLLARVIVNRLWQHHLGRGIVGTPSDFGTQGEPPTHPELLDWLAAELIREGWRLKPIHRLLMTSSVYMQSDQVNESALAADRDNRLFWRREPKRLEAEIVRDSMLAVSGELDRTMYGPGTLDPEQKRRSIYFFVKRSQLIPMMVLFDAPDSLQDIANRPTTTVAPQALMLLNNGAVRGYARRFAERIDEPGASGWQTAVSRGYRIALAREPAEEELAEAAAFLDEQSASYQVSGKENARRLALADFCQVLLGLNEFVYVE